MLLNVRAAHAAKVAARWVFQKSAICVQPARFSQLIIIEEKNMPPLRLAQRGIAGGRDAGRRLTVDTDGWVVRRQRRNELWGFIR